MRTSFQSLLFIYLLALMLTGCSKAVTSQNTPTDNRLVEGADISWLPQKEVMVVEVGGEDIKVQSTYDMLITVQKKVKEVPESKGLGVFYWEPEGARSWSHYALSAWGDDGKPTKDEFENWRSQFATSNSDRMGLRYSPMAFTEHGVLMLSSILNSKKAIEVNIQIMRIFTRIRQIFTDTLSLKQEIEEIKKRLKNQNKNIKLVFSYLDELITKQENSSCRKCIGYKTND